MAMKWVSIMGCLMLGMACSKGHQRAGDRMRDIVKMHTEGHLTADEAMYEIKAEMDLLELLRQVERRYVTKGNKHD